jgi:hypothetical protein
MLILSTKLRNAINAHANGMDLAFDLKNISINGSKRGCSGFIRNNANGSVVYVNTEDSIQAHIPCYMFRYADNEKDFTGYTNHFARSLDQLSKAICGFLENTRQEQYHERRI